MDATRTHTHDEMKIETLGRLSQRVIEAAVAELRAEDELTLAMRAMFAAGMDVNDLSAATGIRPEDVRRRLECELFLGEDIEALFN